MTVRAIWERLCQGEIAGPLFETLDRAYSSPERSYHTWQHISECLEWLDLYSQSASLLSSDYSLLQYALFYHDVVYQPSGHNNERESARLAAAELAPVLSRSQIDVISSLILATSHLSDDDDPTGIHPLAPIIVDIDLAILGAPRARFIEYDRQIRREYSSVEPERFSAGRRSVLERFAERERIYRIDFFASRLEPAARDNIAYALAQFYSS